ncbi:MAG: HD domain-containing protein [Myxococcales bacterium]|nr:HD domain-containing protein [Polyangiaceae bacterium]MDW8250520.1 HD domain-containing protein [Myxococcales bacterium]
MRDYLLHLLLDLHGVRQDPKYHPEGDALFHTLQVFGLALRESRDPVLLAAALLHDVGKAHASSNHDKMGADLLDGFLCPRVVWLVRHHLDLLRNPRRAGYRRTNKRPPAAPALGSGRSPAQRSRLSQEQAVAILFDHPSLFDPGDNTELPHDPEVLL